MESNGRQAGKGRLFMEMLLHELMRYSEFLVRNRKKLNIVYAAKPGKSPFCFQ